ncbi:MAG: GGDEF domain-containing protein [Proteobacteria bacterium]|nr:GGDEF domain-containing protein [Pseudomonadota bacterium]
MKNISTGIQNLMTKKVYCVAPGETLGKALLIMRDKRFSCIVISEEEKPVGILTERDIVKLMADHSPPISPATTIISDVMSSPPVTVNESDTLFEALVVARAEKVRHLPVINPDGRIVGIVTQSDLVKAHFNLYEHQREIVETSIDERTRELIRANKELKALSMEDALLGIGNRRAMEVDLQHTHASATRYQFHYSVMLIDIDYFKNYNDHYGHLAGDDVLKKVANRIEFIIREADRLYRYGGEEFLLLMPETGLKDTALKAGEIVKDVQSLKIPHEKSSFKVLTISIGIGNCCEIEEKANATWSDLVDIADQRLYKAKDKGRCQAVAS